MLPNKNLALLVLSLEGKTIEDYDGWCSTVCDKVLNKFGGQKVWIEGDATWLYDWCYHDVPMIDGYIHDAWFAAWHQQPEPLPLNEYLVKMFGTKKSVRVTIDANDVYEGLPQNFDPEAHLYDPN